MIKQIVALVLRLFSSSALAARPDFSAVDSAEKAQVLLKKGELERIHLFPLELGGEDSELNTVYVPLGFAIMKAKFDGTVAKMLENGSVSQYEASPEYKGKSVVPRKIQIRAWHPDKTDDFTVSMDLW